MYTMLQSRNIDAAPGSKNYAPDPTRLLYLVSNSVAEPEPQGAASFGRSRSRSRKPMRLRPRRLRLRQLY
jgi:hypothetical protein